MSVYLAASPIFWPARVWFRPISCLALVACPGDAACACSTIASQQAGWARPRGAAP